MEEVVVHKVKGLLDLPISLSLCYNVKAELTYMFLCGHPFHLVSQTMHGGHDQINEALLKVLFLLGEPCI